MRALVLGVGRMGTAIAYGMDKLGFHVTGMDTNPEAANNIPQKVNLIDGETPRNEFFIVKNAEDICRGIEAQVKPDIVISSLPYHQTEIVGKYCVDNGVRYCDLGGRVDVSQNINDHAKQHATKPVFTDLGLAPGLVNILAEQGCRELIGVNEGASVEMMVGGLPDYLESANNPLRYKVTWSVDGLINEYRDDCIILENGQIKTVKGMSGVEQLETDSLGKVEAFYTSGGASHSIYSMKERGVTNCSYKTIRYKGHGDMVRFLIRDCELNDETLNKIFVDGCGHANKDEVIVIAKVKKANKTWRKEKLVKSDDQFSAMQKATAFSICSVATIMAKGEMEGNKEQHRDYWEKYNVALSYADVPFDKFHSNLNKLGIDI
jgi:saccharopine dehydrogenase-like NADP-dependent oxidoreductase